MARATLRLGARALALLVLVSVALLPPVSSDDDGYKHCEGVVRDWADSTTGERRNNGGDKRSLKDLLFFLHIPRTGGGAYSDCFLKMLYPNALQCPHSYEKLRKVRPKRDARGIDQVHSSKKVGNAYDLEDMVMPLHQYINDPVAHEIIHNGATFQITGLTNNSYFDGAHDVRHCVRKHPDLGCIVLEVAKNRLDQMLYVGLTEDHEESARLFAHMVGAQVLSQSGTLNLDLKEDVPSETDSHPSMVEPKDEETNELNNAHGWQNNEALNSTSDELGKGNMTIGKLMEAYETCIAELRKDESSSRKISLRNLMFQGARFSKAARKLVPEAILKQIISLNSLDMELYDHAKKIFTQEHLWMLKAQQSLVGHQRQLGEQKEGWISIIWSDEIICCPDGGLPWMVVSTTIVLVILAVMMRKRTSKHEVLTRIHESVSRF